MCALFNDPLKTMTFLFVCSHGKTLVVFVARGLVCNRLRQTHPLMSRMVKRDQPSLTPFHHCSYWSIYLSYFNKKENWELEALDSSLNSSLHFVKNLRGNIDSDYLEKKRRKMRCWCVYLLLTIFKLKKEHA